MTALLRADWLRFRRRLDIWIIAIAVLVAGGIGFIAGWQRDVTDPIQLTPAEIREEVLSYTDFSGSGMSQAEIDAEISQMVADSTLQYEQQAAEWEAQQAVALQKYDVVQAPFTVLGSAIPIAPLAAILLVTTLVMGDEFRFGTVRTSLLASSARRRFLAARIASRFAMTAGIFTLLMVLGLVMALGLRLFGAEVRSSAVPVDIVSGVAWLAAQLLATMVLVGLVLALTVLLRSGALPLLLLILAGLIELFVLALPVFAPGELLAGAPLAFLTMNVRLLTARLAYDTHAVALSFSEIPTTAFEIPVLVSAAIVAAWGAFFLVIADRRFRTMDIVE